MAAKYTSENGLIFPVDILRRFNVNTTSYDIVPRRIDVETTLSVEVKWF